MNQKGCAYRVDTANNGSGADAARDAGEPRVEQALDVAAVGSRLAHDARLRAAVHKGLELHPIHLCTAVAIGANNIDYSVIRDDTLHSDRVEAASCCRHNAHKGFGLRFHSFARSSCCCANGATCYVLKHVKHYNCVLA